MDLRHEDVRRLLQLVDESTHLDELELKIGDVRLRLRCSGTENAAPVIPAPSVPASQGSTATAPAVNDAPRREQSPYTVPAKSRAVPEGMIAIKAPMLGTFFQASAPGEPPFVQVGQRVKADDTVCLIEVMKLFNTVIAGVDGVVAEIRPADGALVEFGEVLIVVKPDGAGA